MKRLTQTEKNKIYFNMSKTSDICESTASLLNRGWARLANFKDKYGAAVTDCPDVVSFDLATAVKKAVHHNYQGEVCKTYVKNYLALVEDAIVQTSMHASIMPQSLSTIDAYNDHPAVKLEHILHVLFLIDADFKKYGG